MQGWRVSMEDAHCHILSLSPEDPDAAYVVLKKVFFSLISELLVRYYGVFDGHGGAKVAAFSANNLHRYIVRRSEYKEGDVEEALRQGFMECDRAMRTEESLKDEMAGCTAVVVMTKGKELWCANAGDSRCIAGVV